MSRGYGRASDQGAETRLRVGAVLPSEEPGGLLVDSEGTLSAVRVGMRLMAAKQPIIIAGPRGSGRRALARALHRAVGGVTPLLTFDLEQVPGEAAAAQLFGVYRRGRASQPGLLARAEGATLVLLGFERLPPPVEARLDMCLVEGVFSPDGGGAEARLRARVVLIGGLGRDGEGALLRQSLAKRTVALEPLQRRGADAVTSLAEHFLSRRQAPAQAHTPTLPEEVRRCLCGYGWPGQVRELRRCMEAAALVADGPLGVQHLPVALRGLDAPRSLLEGATEGPFADLPSLEEVEARYIAHMLSACVGCRSEAARRLGIGRNTLLSKLKRYRLG